MLRAHASRTLALTLAVALTLTLTQTFALTQKLRVHVMYKPR